MYQSTGKSGVLYHLYLHQASCWQQLKLAPQHQPRARVCSSRACSRSHHRQQYKSCICTAKSSCNDAFRELELSPGSSREDVRSAYLRLIKRLHPDLNPGGHSTAHAARVTVAYDILMQAFWDGTIDDTAYIDVFDSPEAEPDQIFINPFACNINPLDWRKLQDVADSAPDNIERQLMREGVFMPSSAIFWLTPQQRSEIVADLTAMEDTLNYELTSWLVNDCLMRSERANNRMPVTWR